MAGKKFPVFLDERGQKCPLFFCSDMSLQKLDYIVLIFQYGILGMVAEMLKLSLCLLSLLLVGCKGITPPPEFRYQEITTRNFKLASWQKIKNPQGVYKIYIEGDGYAFNAHGRASQNPTPRGKLMRELAFGDDSQNVVYLARPCQFVKSEICATRHWTTARFAPEVINATSEAINEIAPDNEVILIGFSGGAQVAGLVAAAKPEIKVKKLITVAGNLNHLAWTQKLQLPPLNESMNLESYSQQYFKIPQIHYVGDEDEVVPLSLTRQFVKNEAPIVVVKGASHNAGWESIYAKIWQEN